MFFEGLTLTFTGPEDLLLYRLQSSELTLLLSAPAPLIFDTNLNSEYTVSCKQQQCKALHEAELQVKELFTVGCRIRQVL